MNTNFSNWIGSASLGVAAALCLLAAGAPQTARAEQKGSPGQLSSHDYHFVTEAAQGGMEEVALGQLAAQKGSSQAVRDFGQRMIQDHQQTDQQLQQIVSQKGAILPSETAGKEQGTVDHLKSLSGTDFDKAYMSLMVKDHKKDVKEFEKAAKSAKDPDVQAFAAKTLPTLQEHLSMAETTHAAVTGATPPAVK